MELPERKMILLGKTGDGKSSAGNTILGEMVFHAKASANSETNKCNSKDGMVNGRKITVIDTPGFFDTECDDTDIKSEIILSLIECAPSIDAVIIVLKVGRYTRQEMEVVQLLLNTVEENVLKHAVILFTFGEQLEDQTIEDFTKGNSQLKELFKKCESRCHVIDSKYWGNCNSGYKSNTVQINNLLDTIDKMVQENGCYTNDVLKYLEKAIKTNMTEDHMTPEAKREKAKKLVHEKLMNNKGAKTKTWIGALLGGGAALALILAVVKTVF